MRAGEWTEGSTRLAGCTGEEDMSGCWGGRRREKKHSAEAGLAEGGELGEHGGLAGSFIKLRACGRTRGSGQI